MIDASANAAAVFDRLGLTAASGAASILDDESSAEGIGRRLREALEQLGGIYAAFGRFLNFRADLLDAAIISNLRELELSPPIIPIAAVASIIGRELGPAAAEL